MEAVYYSARANLRRWMQREPGYTQRQLAAAVGMSVGWVKKWCKRLREADEGDETVLQSRSRARKQPPERISEQVVDRLIQMRDEPPEGLGRTPGPKALLYYLPRDEALGATGLRLPRSTRTVHRLLKQAGRIPSRCRGPKAPMERPAAMSQWQLDFKDASTVPPEPEGKRQHGVEVLNTVDVGTSVLLSAQVRPDFVAETTLQAVVEVFQTYGCPQQISVDRDVRFVSSPQGSDFPSALLRFCGAVGVHVRVCDPQSPQQNGFVERYHRSYDEECLAPLRPRSLQEVRSLTETFVEHYTFQRPHQGLSCHNQPPRVACASLPSLPPLPDVVNPDAWLSQYDGLHLLRTVRRDGSVRIDLQSYYVGRALAGQRVSLHLQAHKQSWSVLHQGQVYKSLPLKGVVGKAMPIDAFVQMMSQQARAEHRLCTAQQRRARLGAR